MITLYVVFEQYNDLANVYLNILFIGCTILWNERRWTPLIALFLMGLPIYLLIRGDGLIVNGINLIVLGGAFSAIYFKRSIDFFYNRLRFESADFNSMSNFIYNKFIQKRN